MSFKVTIINNENGEVLVNEENAVAVIGAITNADHTQGVGYTNCNALRLAESVRGARASISALLKSHPEIELLVRLAGVISSDEGEDEA